MPAELTAAEKKFLKGIKIIQKQLDQTGGITKAEAAKILGMCEEQVTETLEFLLKGAKFEATDLGIQVTMT